MYIYHVKYEDVVFKMLERIFWFIFKLKLSDFSTVILGIFLMVNWGLMLVVAYLYIYHVKCEDVVFKMLEKMF